MLYDTLVTPAILEHAAHARKMCISELGPRHCERIHAVKQKLIEEARLGKCVVRLKGGDSLLFGRGGEEAQALREAGIDFEIVPGVTAAIGAAAFTGIPLTHRGISSAVTLVTGHDNPGEGETDIDWGLMAKLPGTLAVYMGLSRLAAITQALIRNGKPSDTPAAVVHAATLGSQQTIVAPLGLIADKVKSAGFKSPSLIIIGPVVEQRDSLSWFEHRPLFGKRVLICRPRVQAAELARRLEELGAVALTMPVVEILPPLDPQPMLKAIARISDFQWLVFTSVNGVQAFLDRLLKSGHDLRVLGHLRIAAIGPATAAALESYHLVLDVMPDEYRSEKLADALREHVSGKRVLLVRADRGREVLRDELEKFADVHQVAAYSQVDVEKVDPSILDMLRDGNVDYIVLTSSNIAHALARLLDNECVRHLSSGRTKIVSISPVTTATIREHGWPIAAEASKYTMDGVLQALQSV